MPFVPPVSPPTKMATLPALAASYREQMRLYAGGAARLWPGRRVKSYLLFTACNRLFDMDDATDSAPHSQ